MKSGEVTRVCKHRMDVNILWIRNEPEKGPPAIFISGTEGPICVTLTNQTFYVKCPKCFETIREALLSKY